MEVLDINTNKFNDIKEIMNNKYFSNTRYSQFVRLIMSESNIQKFYFLLEEYKNIYHLTNKNLNIKNEDIIKVPSINIQNTKTLLSLYVIMFYPKIMNVDGSKGTGLELLNMCKKLNAIFKFNLNYFVHLNSKINDLNNIKSINNYIKLFFTKYNEYLEIFDKWKRIDLEGLIYELTASFINLEKEFENIKDEYMERYLLILRRNDVDESDLTLEYKTKFFDITYEAFLREKNEYLKKIRSLDKNNGEQKFNEYYQILKNKNAQNLEDYENDEEFVKKLGELINKNIEESIWEDFEKDLNQEPPILDKLVKYIDEIKRSILVSAPRKEKKLIKNELDIYMDIEFIKHKIEYKIITNDDLLSLIKYIIDKLKKYQAEIDDLDTFTFEENLPLLFKRKSQVRVLRDFFSWVIPRFQSIVRMKYEFFKMLENNRI